MKTSTQTIFNTKLAMRASVIAAIACISIAAATSFTKVEVASPMMANNDVINIVIEGKRMTAEQKLAYDLNLQENSFAMTTIVIRAKRLSEEQKLQMDQQDLMIQASIKSKANRHQING